MLFYKKYIFNYGRKNLPIGVSISGDLLCMGMQRERYGKIYYWYHEDESERILSCCGVFW